MWYVYVLKSVQQQFLYIGSTNDLKRRLQEHNDGTSKSTAPYRPFTIATFIAFPTAGQARVLEKYFKTGSGRTVLKKRILHDEDLAEYEVHSEA